MAQDTSDGLSLPQSISDDELFKLSIDMLCVADMEGHFLRVSPAFEKTLGWTTEELLSKPFLEFVHPDDRDGTLQALADLGDGERIMDFENRYRHQDGSFRWFQWRAVPHREVVYAMARDVTEARQQAQERLQLERRMLQSQKLESLGVLAGGIAHDFNNLLSGILGHAEFALLKLPPDSVAREDIDKVCTTAIRASELCNQMLAYSGQGKFLVRRFRLTELVREMVSLIEVSISKKVHLQLELDESMPQVEGDSSQVRQVVLNLLTNASEAIGDEEGTITVRTGVTEADASYLARGQVGGTLEPGAYAFIEIEDTGQGMDAATREKIFDPFFSTKFTGRGLGLAAVLGIVRGHQGAIRLHSVPGQGTRFEILLPVWGEVEEKADGVEAVGSYRGYGKVLVADDDSLVRQASKKLLTHFGFEVLAAKDGRECLDLYDRHEDEIRLVLLDLTMPRLGGLETLQELRRKDESVRVLMVSGYSDHGLDLPEDDKGLAFLQKPFRGAVLEETLRKLLESGDD